MNTFACCSSPTIPLATQFIERLDCMGSSHRSDVLGLRPPRSSRTISDSPWFLCSISDRPFAHTHSFTATATLMAPSSCRKLAPRRSHSRATNCFFIGCHRSRGAPNLGPITRNRARRPMARDLNNRSLRRQLF